MANRDQTVYLVDPTSDPVVLRIQGRATYLNCAPVSRLFDALTNEGRNRFLIDFVDCTGMDSTFLGLLAGLAIELRKEGPPACLCVTRLSSRNLELIQNLGLSQLLDIESAEAFEEVIARSRLNESEAAPGKADPGTILEAHQNLVEADSGNYERFKDVIEFLSTEG